MQEVIQTAESENKIYKFRGKTFPAHPNTIQQLNYALALNRCQDRYVEVVKKTKKK